MRPSEIHYRLTAYGLLSATALMITSPLYAQQDPGYGCAPGYGFTQNYGPGPGYGQGYGYGNRNQPGYGPRYMHEMDGRRGMSPGWAPARMARMIDADADGVLSADEVAARHEEVFSTMDADADGALTEDEFLAMRLDPGAGYGPRHEQRQADKQARFKTMDSDANGAISQGEFMAGGEQRFAASDLDKDGKVTVWEFRSRRRTWQ